MERGASPVLTTRVAQSGGAMGATTGRPGPPRPGPGRTQRVGRGRTGALIAGFRDSCALVGVALLGCLTIIAVGTLASLFWTFVIER
ncbi:MAG TPA: hypothetical protein VMT69_05525 [Kineosporiaceae bacterium]|nr:hypothetical protein [Kineosporiaceae bacterium]